MPVFRSKDRKNRERKNDKNGPLSSDVSGISFAEKCPEGDEWWAAHMTSGIKFTVVCEGNYTDPRGMDGCCFAYWNAEEPTKMKGCRVRTGGMKMHGQDVTWQVRIGASDKSCIVFEIPKSADVQNAEIIYDGAWNVSGTTKYVGTA